MKFKYIFFALNTVLHVTIIYTRLGITTNSYLVMLTYGDIDECIKIEKKRMYMVFLKVTGEC